MLSHVHPTGEGVMKIWGLTTPAFRFYGIAPFNVFSPDKALLERIAVKLGLEVNQVIEVREYDTGKKEKSA